MKNIIGIIGRKRTFNNRDYLVFNKELVDIIYSYNCIPLGILLDFDNDDYKNFINICDGIILQGGDDNYPIDNDIIKYIYDKNIPALGICLGFQLMGNAFNGKIESINSLKHQSNENYVHKNIIESNSFLHKILGKNKIDVNSRHYDNLVKTDLCVSAYSDDGIIEAIEEKNKDFFIGIQWHPETLNDENSRNIFDTFFDVIEKKQS